MTDDNSSFIDSISQAAYVVGFTRLNEGGRGKSSWENGYTLENFFSTILEQAFRVEIEESLDSYFRTAKVFINDRQAVMTYFPLTGSEIISIQYWNSIENKSSNLRKKILHFSILNVEEVSNIWEGHEKGSRIVVLHLIECPVFQFLTQNTRYKTFEVKGGNKKIRDFSSSKHPERNLSISDIMESLINPNNKNCNESKINSWYESVEIEPTKSGEDFKLNFYVPNWSISKALNYLKKFAISKDDYPYYIFYTLPPEKEGLKPTIHLKPLYNLFERKSYQIFSQNFAPSMFRPSVTSTEDVVDYNSEEYPFDPLNVFTNYSIDIFNAIQTVFSGLSGETFASFDYVEDNKYIGYDYRNFIDSHHGLGNYSLHAFDYGNQWSNLRKHSFNEPNRLLSMKRNEFAKRQLQSAMSCLLQGTLNHTRRIGDMADVIFRSPLGDTENPEYFIDQVFSGRWLIWAQREVMTVDTAYSVCHLVKEGYTQEMVSKSKVDFDKILNKFSKNLHPRKVE